MSFPAATWRAARRDYEANGLTQSAISEKYGMQVITIARKVHEQGWQRLSKDITSDLIRADIIKELQDSGAIKAIPIKLNAALNALDKIDQTTPDYKTINDAIKEILKIVGAYAPVKTEVDLKQELKIIIGKIQAVIVEFVPDESKRNECIDKLMEVLK